MLRRIGFSSSLAFPMASSPHGYPVHQIVGMFKEVRALLVDQSVGPSFLRHFGRSLGSRNLRLERLMPIGAYVAPLE